MFTGQQIVRLGLLVAWIGFVGLTAILLGLRDYAGAAVPGSIALAIWGYLYYTVILKPR